MADDVQEAGPQQAPADAPDTSTAPTPQEAGVQPQAAPNVQGAPQMPTQAPSTPGSKWANVVKGALSGLALGGAPGFVAGAIAPTATRQAFKNNLNEGTAKAQQAQANVRFTDAQAASMQSETAMRQIQAEQLPKQQQLAIQKADLDTAKFLTDHGANPVITTDGTHPEAYQAGLQSVSDSNGGVPALVTLHVGDKLVSYDVSQLGTNTGVLQQINKVRAVQGLPPMDNSMFFNSKITPPAAKAKMIADSLQFFNPVPKSGDSLNGQVQQYKNFLAQAQNSPDLPDKADTVEKLTSAVKLLQGSLDSRNTDKINLAKTSAMARASAINMTKGVEVASDNGSTHYVTMGDAIKNGAVGASTGKSLLPLEKTAEDAEKSYQMFNSAYADYKAGTPTGAQSMLALSQHLATTFGNVKGSRITKDMIQEHLGARSISDSATVALNRFQNGDALSPDQWEAFKGLIGQSRKLSWGNYATTSAAKGINVRGLVPKDLGGTRDITDTTATPGAKSGGKISVTDPQGGIHTFPDQASADNFKRLAKIQ